MNLVNFPDGACDKVRRHLDSYLDNELPEETKHEVLRHLETCLECSRELEERARLKARVRQAASQVLAPAGLDSKVHSALLDYQQRNIAGRHRYWLMSAAAVVVLGFIAWRTSNLANGREKLAQFLRIGVVDHEQCAVPRDYSWEPPNSWKMESELGPVFQDLLPVVRQKVPREYRLELAHQCTVSGRQYVHFIFRKEPSLVSVIVTRKQAADSFPSAWGPIGHTQVDQYQAAGGEARNYWFYVVSNISADQNQQIAVALNAPLRDYLSAHTANVALDFTHPGW